ncbi:MAG: MerR family transcriptional regulator [Faecalicatena sp.]|uniref:MerR family transcriptional regulator n=1 Tax=Faecalicatena sp. TaxID=2005360 RepID=UPI00258D8EA8|nr:MerR family transcriptional regulator [Faecalicatena sp.]MCI6467085.1 MerR family transcriptional regulator [Faecalicatena sp.]MDY5618869.1 MerR family transcriptional regulator [Lachnospiraceae bacterium]
MEYSIREVSEIAGISARTLRYYDSIGLLKPAGIRDSGYRYYGERELEMLQQILFYRERGFKLEQIAKILYSEDFDVMSALREHLEELEKEQAYIHSMITTVKKTIASMKGEITMNDQEKFEAFKKDAVKKNEETYGPEIRKKYGDEEVDASNQKMLNMTDEEYQRFDGLSKELNTCLKSAVQAGEKPEGEAGRKAAGLHKEWLKMTWKTYSVEAHKGVAQMYTEDERFTKYYDSEVSGCAAFLTDAVKYWAEKL